MGNTDENDGLRELLQNAITGRSPQDSSAKRPSEKENSGSYTPFQNSLLATLLPSTLREGPPSIAKRMPTKPVSPLESSSQLSARSESMAKSLQELYLDSVDCQSTAISQVKHPSHRVHNFGNLISATRHCIAYVLNDRKIRMIAQENAAMGLMDLHDTSRIPIVDIAWSMQESAVEAGTNFHSSSSQQLLASVSQGGEVCIGAVYAESSTALVYEPIISKTFPELQPARGVVWNENNDSLLLAVYGEGPEIFLMSVNSPNQVATLKTDLDSIHAVKFGTDGEELFVADLEKVAILSVHSFQETFIAKTISLVQGVRRVWLLPHTLGMIVVASIGTEQLLIIPLHDPSSEIIISINLPGIHDQLFAVLDQVSSTLCVGALNSSRIICVNLLNFSKPIVSAGSWANDSTAVSVFATSQLHSVFSKAGTDGDMFLYAYHQDSVKMHRLKIDWEATKSAEEPGQLPAPSKEILRPSSRFGASGSSTPMSSTSRDEDTVRHSVAKSSADRVKKDASAINISKLESKSFQDIQKGILVTLNETVHQEISRLFDTTVIRSVEKSLSHMEQKLERKCEEAVIRSIGKPDKLATGISNQIQQAVKSSVDKSIKDTVENNLLPGLQSIMADLVGQLSANLSQAIVDSTIEQYKIIMSEMSQLRQTVIELQHKAFKLPSAQELAQSVSNEIRQSFSPVYGNAPQVPQVSLNDELTELIRTDKPYVALVKVLEIGNVQLLDWILPLLDAATIIESKEMQPAVLLSLIQQIGFELHSLTELKLEWLAEIFTIVDPSIHLDSKLEDTFSTVLDELFANLRIIFAEAPANSATQKKVKTVMRLVRMMMTT